MISSNVLLAGLVGGAAAGLYPGMTPDNHTCILSDPMLSCTDSATPDNVDTCCVETYGGLVLLTQFWNTYTGMESSGQVLPQDSWTIHGLWPDFCNGSYTQYCDLSRQYDPKPYPNTTDGTPDGTPVPAYEGKPITRWFERYGKLDLLAYMSKFWPSQNEPSWILWAHEYSKHATCFSTFDLECYGPKAAKHDDAFDYFETTVAIDRTLPTWGWLATDSIRPSNETSYSLNDIQAALTRGFGALPFVGCTGPAYNETDAGKGSMDNGKTQLNEVWYYYHVYGKPQRNQGMRVPADVAGGWLTSCATSKDAIWYYERAEGSEV